jgi:hypothetical protein
MQWSYTTTMDPENGKQMFPNFFYLLLLLCPHLPYSLHFLTLIRLYERTMEGNPTFINQQVLIISLEILYNTYKHPS